MDTTLALDVGFMDRHEVVLAEKIYNHCDLNLPWHTWFLNFDWKILVYSLGCRFLTTCWKPRHFDGHMAPITFWSWEDHTGFHQSETRFVQFWSEFSPIFFSRKNTDDPEIDSGHMDPYHPQKYHVYASETSKTHPAGKLRWEWWGVCVLGKRSGYGSGVWATQVWKT